GNGDDYAAFGGTVQLGEDDPGAAGSLLELLSLDEAVLTGSSIQNQQGLHRRLLQLPVDDLSERMELRHEVCLVMEPSGGIADHHVHSPSLDGLDKIKKDSAGIGPFLLAHQLAAGTIGPDLQLIGSGSTEGVAGTQQYPLAFLPETVCQLPDRSCL